MAKHFKTSVIETDTLTANSVEVEQIVITGGAAILSGVGSPEGVVTATVGSLYTNTEGGEGTTLYIKESGEGNTGWEPAGTDNSTPLVLNVKTYGASGDGVTDDTVVIQEVINACSAADGGVVYIPNGTYVVSKQTGILFSSVNLKSNVTLRGESQNGTVLLQAPNSVAFTRLIGINNQDDIVVENLTLDGNYANQTPEEHMAGAFLYQCERVQFHNVTSHSFPGDGYVVSNDVKDLLIEDCVAYGNYRNGFTVSGSNVGVQTRLTWSRCRFYDNTQQQLDFESACAVSDVLVDGCYIASHASGTNAAVAFGGDTVSNRLSRGTFRNTRIYGYTICRYNDDLVFDGCRLETRTTVDTASCLEIGRLSTNVVVSNCTIVERAVSGKGAILVLGTSLTDLPINVRLVNNTIQVIGNVGNGVHIENAKSVRIAGNRILGSSAATSRYGVSCRAAHSVIVGDYMDLFELSNNHIEDWRNGVILYGYTTDPGNQKITQAIITNNHFAKVSISSYTYAIDFSADGTNVVRQATLIGNSVSGGVVLVGPSAGFGDGWPQFPTLVGGNPQAGGVYSHTGSPEGVLTERVGALYFRRDGGANTTMYVKESGTSNTGWVAK